MEYLTSEINDSTVWTEKYCPKQISEIIGNEKNINLITNWLNSFETNRKQFLIKKRKDDTNKKRRKIKIKVPKNEEELNNDEINETIDESIADSYNNKITRKTKTSQCKSSMIITGNHGVGKTCIVQAILQSLGYVIQILNFGKVKTNKSIKEIIDKIMNSTDIYSIIHGKKNSKIAIVIDELEAITSLTGKNCIYALLKNNEENWFCPIIFISNNQHNKLLSDIKKNSYEIRFWPPHQNELLTLLKRITGKEKMNINGMSNSNYTTAYKIIEHCQNDYRRLILTLQDLKYSYDNTIITTTMIEKYCELSKKKDEDFNLFKATNFLLQKYNGIEDCIRYYETEKVLLPLMIHQNYIECIKQKCNNDKKYKLANEISELLSEGDVIENYIYGDQNWDINEVHGFYTCVAPSYLLCNMKESVIDLDFPADLNKASIGKINRKT